MAFDSLERVRAHLHALDLRYELDDAQAAFAVDLARETTATIALTEGPAGGLLVAQLLLLADTSDDLRAAASLARWTPEHWFIKFCRYDSGSFVARTELLAAHLDSPELGATLTALYDALSLAPDAQRQIGGEVVQARWDADVALRRLDLSEAVPPDELLARIGQHLEAGGLPASARNDHYLLRTAGDVGVEVSPADEGRVVSIAAVLARDVRLDDPRAAQLLEANGNILFGGLGIREEDRSLVLEHDLVAATLDAQELVTALVATAATIDGFGAYFANILGRAPVTSNRVLKGGQGGCLEATRTRDHPGGRLSQSVARLSQSLTCWPTARHDNGPPP